MKKRELGVLREAAESSAEVRDLVPDVVFLSKQGSVLTCVCSGLQEKHGGRFHLRRGNHEKE